MITSEKTSVKARENVTVLIVDDEASIVSSITRSLEESYTCLGASNAEEAKTFFKDHSITCILSDQRMPGETGSQLLNWVRERSPDTIRILMTGYTDFESLVDVINKGQIYHYLQKPWEPAQLDILIENAVSLYTLTQENRRLEAALKRRNQILESENRDLKSKVLGSKDPLEQLIGFSSSMQKLKDRMKSLLSSQSPVLISGESGTGKELVACALHYQGSRKEKPFVAQNCAALPDSILESELFGHVKGAFTHALDNSIGIFESANGGTLFLDEVGDMSLTMQAKLLRFLQEGTFTPVGGRIEKRVDVRIIAATHRNLEAMIAEKTFREDLFYRLNVVPLRTPPLRERLEDIPLLAEHFIMKKAGRAGSTVVSLDPAALKQLGTYAYPGNVRELENAIEYALNFVGERPKIESKDLPEKFHTLQDSQASATGSAIEIPQELSLDEAVEALEKVWVERAMQTNARNVTQAARQLGLSRQGLHNKLSKYNI